MKRNFKYKNGDCLSFKCADNYFIAGLVTGIYKSYYDITLIEYRQKNKPNIADFENCKFFGTRSGSLEDIEYMVDKRMFNKSYVDKSEDIQLICSLNFPDSLGKASYAYVNDINELLKYYTDELPVRIEKTKNADKFPEIGFMSRHLIDIRQIADKATKC